MKMMDYGDLECGQSSVGGTSFIMFHNHGFMTDYKIPYVVQIKSSIKKRLSKHRIKIRTFRYYC